MKSLTGLPSPAYVRIAEEAGVQLSDLLKLVQELEAGSTPAYLAYYRPNIAAGLSEERLRVVDERLRQFLDLEDRRITILTAIGQKDQLTPELRAQIESTTDRWVLEDLYFPFKPKRRSAADAAIAKGLEPLADALWAQHGDNGDPQDAAQAYVSADKGVSSAADALRGARTIMARRTAEDYEVRQGLRAIMQEHAQLVVPKEQKLKGNGKGRAKPLLGYQAKVKKVAWRQMLAIRRAERESGLRHEIQLPVGRAVSFILGRLLESRPAKSPVCLQLGDVACIALEEYLSPALRNELTQRLDERCDAAAIEVYQQNLEKTLKSPPAGPITVIGLETGRPGGWRAALAGPDGGFLEGAIVHRPKGGQASSGDAKKQPVANGAATENEAAAGPNGAADAVESGSGTAEASPQADSATTQEGLAEPSPGSERESAAASATEAAPPEQSAEAAEAEETAESAEAGAAASSDQATEVVQPEAGSPADQAATPSEAAPSQEVGSPAGDATAEAPAVESPDAESRAAESGGEVATMPGPPGKGKHRPKTIEEAFVPLADLLRRHQVDAIVMANGPGVRQVETLVRSAIREADAKDIYWTKLSEAGSWIYATSKAARRELPDVAVAQRSAACLARRLQDPLAQLVHVDPRLLGVGQFHHEVDQKKLRAGLSATLESTVHRIGVDLNTGSIELLALLPGMTERVAKRVVEHRQSKGPFTKREQLQAVSGLSARIYKQAVGFARVRNGENPLDDTGIHPESYPQAEKILAAAGVSAAEALERVDTLDAVALDELKDATHPVDLLRGIVDQFRPAARDPRGRFTPASLPVELRGTEEIQPGKKVEGVVTNIADFGAFVDIGADHDGLVHISQLSNGPGKDAKPEFKIGDRVTVFIRALERDGKRISLSLKDPREVARAARAARPGAGQRTGGPGAAGPGVGRPGARGPGVGGQRTGRPRSAGPGARRDDGPRKRRKEPQREGGITQRSFGPDAKTKALEEKEIQKLSLNEKLELLQSKYRTKF